MVLVVYCFVVGFVAQASPKYDRQVEALLSKMSLDEKVGQMVPVDAAALKDGADIQKYFPGSMLSGGSSDPSPDNSINSWLRAVNEYESWSLKARLKIPRNALQTSYTIKHIRR